MQERKFFIFNFFEAIKVLDDMLLCNFWISIAKVKFQLHFSKKTNVRTDCCTSERYVNLVIHIIIMHRNSIFYLFVLFHCQKFKEREMWRSTMQTYLLVHIIILYMCPLTKKSMKRKYLLTQNYWHHLFIVEWETCYAMKWWCHVVNVSE